jgi:hypothetical protein
MHEAGMHEAHTKHKCTKHRSDPNKEPISSADSDVADIAKNYKKMKRMTKTPVQIDPALARLCRGANIEDIKRSKKVTGPHAFTRVHMYMNDIAAKAFSKKPYMFPVGATIVKDKSAQGYRDAEKFVVPDDGVGGMIKRSPGYDSENGDWEYFYFTDIDSIESGKIKTCIECHSKTAQSDYVYGHWSKPRSN